MERRLENWSVVVDDPFRAPETGGQCLAGNTYGDPRRADGTHVVTSPVVSVNGALVTTRSGSVYRLGEASAEYVAWLAEYGIPFDPANPVRVVRISQ